MINVIFKKKFKAQFVPLFIVLEKTFLYGWKGLVKTFFFDVRMASLAQWKVAKDGP